MSGQAASASAWYSLAGEKLIQGDVDGAISAYGQSLRLQPGNPLALNNLGAALIKAGRYSEAISTLQTALALQPGYRRALVNLGKALREAGHLTEAVLRLREALAGEPGNTSALINLGDALAATGELQESQRVLERAVGLNPELVEAHMTLGIVRLQSGETAQALDALRTAVALSPNNPDAHSNLAHALFVSGRWEEAWPHFEYRFQRHAHRRKWIPPVGVARWDGALNPPRDLLLVGEQGLGDQIQFARYAKTLELLGMRCVLACDVRITRLLAQSQLASRVVSLNEDLSAELSNAEWVPLLSLPAWHRTQMDSVPFSDSYLSVDPHRVHRWRERLDNLRGMRVGLAWAGNPQMETGRYAGRSPNLAALAPLMSVCGINFVSLQKRGGEEQLSTMPFAAQIVQLTDLDPGVDAFLDTAAVLKSIDLLITSDTAIAHLGGALGVPTWLCLMHQPDWRWMDAGCSTPWYDSVRLFRQPRPGDWASVYAEVAGELEARRRGDRVPLGAGSW